MTKKAVVKKQEPIVFLKGDYGFTSSLIISDKFEVRHDNVLRKIRELIKKDVGGLLNYEVSEYKDSSGKWNKMYLMDKSNFIILAMKFTNEVAIRWQVKFVKRFKFLENLRTGKNAQQSESEWIETRVSGKAVRFLTTDKMKIYVEYCYAHGSKNAQKYYMILTKMVNENAFIANEKFDNLRDWMNVEQLKTLSIIETIIGNALQDGMTDRLPYKDIYKLAKKRVIAFVALYGKTEIVANIPKQIALF